MYYRNLGRTGLSISEIGLGAEWLERHDAEEVCAVIDRCVEHGINILDCWMAEPNVRSNIGTAIAVSRDHWIVQGHFGTAWQNGQFTKTRRLPAVKKSFEDLLRRLQTDRIDIGMIFYVDDMNDYREIVEGPFLEYVREQKNRGTIGHIGMSTHNPAIGIRAVEDGIVEVLMFPVNAAFDLLPASSDLESYFTTNGFVEEAYKTELGGIEAERAALYQLCADRGVGLTVMKGYGGGRLLHASTSPFGTALTPSQCLHYALSTPAVASVLVGCNTPGEVDAAVQYENAGPAEKDFAAILSKAPRHTYLGHCTYCGHCAPCPAHIDIAMVNKLYDLAVVQSCEIPASVQTHYDDLEAHAEDCLNCRACEARCPFQVKIASRMKKARDLLGK